MDLFKLSGRATRRDFWAMFLLTVIAFFCLRVAQSVFGEHTGAGIGLVFVVPAFWVYLATCVRRFHDVNMSGWTVFLGAIPIVGGIIVLYLCGIKEGDPHTNSYGSPPF